MRLSKDNIPGEVEADLRKSGLTWGEVQQYGWFVVDPTEPGAFENLKTLLGRASYNGHNILRACTSILVIHYPLSNFKRVKLYPPLNGVKYLQPAGISPAPYILPGVAELANKPRKPVIIVEGEKKTLCLIKHGFHAIGLPGVWTFKNKKQGLPFLEELAEWDWRGRIVHICFDSDAIYNIQVLRAEIELGLNLYARGAKVFIIRLPQPDHQNKLGVDDFITQEGIDAFRELYNGAVTFFEAYSVDYYEEVVKRIAALVDANILLHGQVELITSRLSKTWKVKKSVIDKDIGRLVEPQDQGETSIVEELKPYEGEVNGSELADEVEQILKDYVFLERQEYYTAVTLWILLTYTFEKFPILPMLLITSPVMRCGKTTLLSILRGLTNKALIASNISPAAVYRTVEEYKPTLLLDEADTGLAANEELRGIINAGHTKDTAFVIRVGSKETNFEPENLNTFCPKAIAMIGKPSNTWVDRSIHIKMERKPRNIRTKKISVGFYGEMRSLRQKLKKWACSDLKQIEFEGFDLPSDRAADNWQPLLMIAYNLGEEWFKRAHKAMVTLETDNLEEEGDLRIELLKDISFYFENEGVEEVSSKQLTEHLNSLEDRPWQSLRKGRGITPRVLAEFLAPFNIRPETVRGETPEGGKWRLKGYKLKNFEKVFSRYLPLQNVTTGQCSNHAGFQGFQNVTKGDSVTDKNLPKPTLSLDCHVVTEQKGDIEHKCDEGVVI